MVKRIEGGEQPVADGGGARGRELLPAHDGAQAGEARLAPAQREAAGFFRHRLEARIMKDQLRDRGFELGLRMEKLGHALFV